MKDYQQAVEIWFKYYQSQTGLKYRFTAKDGNHLKQLLAYFDQDIEKFSKFLVSIKDPWVLERLTIPIINSKLNILMQQMKKTNKEVYHPLESVKNDLLGEVDYEAVKKRLGINKDNHPKA